MAIARRKNPNSYYNRLTLLKKLIWLYFLLLIFEGALRKWVAPQLSAPLLVIRDPVALMIIWEAYRTHKWPTRWSLAITLVTLLLVGLFILQSIAGDNPLVGLYGLHSYLLPFPVMFIMGENLDAEDLRKIGVCTLFLLIPEAALAVGQYLSPSGSFINNGAYEGAQQIGYEGSIVRASGTFSFVIGLSQYGTLAAAFLFYAMAKEGFVKQWLLWASAFSLILMIPMTGARTLVAQLAAVLCCVILSAMLGTSNFVRVLRILLPIVLLGVMASFLPFFSDAMHTMTDRFTGATAVEGGSVESSLLDRTLDPAIRAIEEADSSNNWMGLGLGRGAVAVQEFLHGSNEAVAGEDEFSREMGEMGPIAGSLYILFKLFLSIAVLGGALARAREQEPLSLLLVPLATSTLMLFIPEQPTVQGFIVIGMGFCIAAARMPAPAAQPLSLLALQRQQVLNRRRVQRG